MILISQWILIYHNDYLMSNTPLAHIAHTVSEIMFAYNEHTGYIMLVSSDYMAKK